jgi:hypothetical protein
MSENKPPQLGVYRIVIRRLQDRVESRKHDAARLLTKMAEYIESEEWDLARGLCHIGASCFESLRDDTNRLSDLDG